MNQEQMKQFYADRCAGKELPRENVKNDFNEKWKFPSIVRKQYGEYTRYDIAPLNEQFKNGREKYVCAFKNKNELVGLHLTMQLTSKSTLMPYFVCQVEPMGADKEPEPEPLTFGTFKDEDDEDGYQSS